VVGVSASIGEQARTLPEFYRALWSGVTAGDAMSLSIKRDTQNLDLEVHSVDRCG
tara:strand:- start:749 stop:913 length:165 start_codon:yes stop_codon:yes gene_type:complete